MNVCARADAEGGLERSRFAEVENSGGGVDGWECPGCHLLMHPGESARRLGLKRGRKVVRVDIRLGKRLAGMWPLLRLKVLGSQPRLTGPETRQAVGQCTALVYGFVAAARAETSIVQSRLGPAGRAACCRLSNAKKLPPVDGSVGIQLYRVRVIWPLRIRLFSANRCDVCVKWV